MPVNWEEVVGKSCAVCGGFASHMRGGVPICCPCHGGNVCTVQQTAMRHIQYFEQHGVPYTIVRVFEPDIDRLEVHTQMKAYLAAQGYEDMALFVIHHQPGEFNTEPTIGEL